MVIEINDLSIYYGKKNVLNELSLTIPKGKITTIIGANGSGKSTLIKAIAKLNSTNEGTIKLDNVDINKYDRKTLARKISYLAQINDSVDDLSVYDVVKQGLFLEMNIFGKLNQKDQESVKEILKFTGLYSKKNQKLSELSGGEVQRVWIALTLVQNTNCIILDEPTNHLDVKYGVEILKLIQEYNKKFNKTIILVLHDINLAARISDNLVLLKKGKIINQGSPEQVINKTEIDLAYEVDSYITKCPIYNTPVVTII